ncbi:hypothetical protein HKX48_004803 [Thoreauomyces humboldtii]|nr:hypothetical protein HKX48_004803 [Thoreauomyces humboldtii]
MTRSLLFASAFAAAAGLLATAAPLRVLNDPAAGITSRNSQRPYFAAGVKESSYSTSGSPSKSSYSDSDYDVYKAIMCGEREVPFEVKGEPGFGFSTVILNKKTRSVEVVASHFNVGPLTKAHIHGPADAAHNASVLFSILPAIDPNFSTTENPIRNTAPITLNDDQVKQLAQGLFYVNLHDAAHPEGAMRGQLQCASKSCEGADGDSNRFKDDGVCNHAIFGSAENTYKNLGNGATADKGEKYNGGDKSSGGKSSTDNSYNWSPPSDDGYDQPSKPSKPSKPSQSKGGYKSGGDDSYNSGSSYSGYDAPAPYTQPSKPSKPQGGYKSGGDDSYNSGSSYSGYDAPTSYNQPSKPSKPSKPQGGYKSGGDDSYNSGSSYSGYDAPTSYNQPSKPSKPSKPSQPQGGYQGGNNYEDDDSSYGGYTQTYSAKGDSSKYSNGNDNSYSQPHSGYHSGGGDSYNSGSSNSGYNSGYDSGSSYSGYDAPAPYTQPSKPSKPQGGYKSGGSGSSYNTGSGYHSGGDDSGYSSGSDICSSARSHFQQTGSQTLIQCVAIACNPQQSQQYIERALYQCAELEKAARRNNGGQIPNGW